MQSAAKVYLAAMGQAVIGFGVQQAPHQGPWPSSGVERGTVEALYEHLVCSGYRSTAITLDMSTFGPKTSAARA